MLSIQEVGQQVLTGKPKSFYIFIGEEYGIKEKYLDNLKNHYQDSSEISKVSELFEIMNHKRIIPLQPKLYIARYDEEFIQNMDKNTAAVISKMESKIIGTLVCVYELPKHVNKCLKYLPDHTVSFDGINSNFIKKYLTVDFPSLESSLIDFSVQLHKDYKSAYNACISLSNADTDVLTKYNGTELSKALGTSFSASESQFRQGIASRNFGYCLSVVDNYNGDLNLLIYTFLSTMIDLEKLLSNPKQQSDLSKYNKCWNIADVYNMFMNVYNELEKSRSISTYDVYTRLVYLISILQFSPVPEVDAI
ncbi:MAG: hypothetical protein NC320_01895 [Clostridium sp.]|nr:hypothetical protein [Clostridium sp.]